MVLATPAGAPARQVRGTPALKAQLKKLWQRGANAKHQGNYDGARKTWRTARAMAPHWPGFEESIKKLPR
jgi:hypothetical protein